MKQPVSLKHKRFGRYIKDIVYGANDGIITTFAVVAGVAGATLGEITIIILGLASLIADGFSMAASSYLGSKSEKEFFRRERDVESWEFENVPEEEMSEMRFLLKGLGYNEDDANNLTELLKKNKNFWLDVMMREELHLSFNKKQVPWKEALATFIAFVVAGFVPIAPFLFLNADGIYLLTVAGIATAVALFAVGSMRTLITGERWFVSGIEMLIVGGIAATLAYAIGFLIRQII